MTVKVHTVGRLTAGKYKDWYVFVQTYKSRKSYLVLICNNKMFGMDDNGKLIEGSQCYDNWIPDELTLEYHFERQGWQVEWLEDWKPLWLKDEPD